MIIFCGNNLQDKLNISTMACAKRLSNIFTKDELSTGKGAQACTLSAALMRERDVSLLTAGDGTPYVSKCVSRNALGNF